MSPVKIIIVLIGLAAAVGAVLMARTVLSDNAAANTQQPVFIAAEEEVPTVDILVSARDIRVGETLATNDMTWLEWPELSLNPNQITRDEQPDAIEELTGHVVRVPIFEKEPLLPQKVVSRGDTGVMAALVSPGMRAVSLEISVESASGGFILPDDRVDVILTHEIEVTTTNGIVDEIQSVIMLENVRVLAIDQGTDVGTENATSIGSTATLELSPDDAALVAFGARKGVLTLALRSLTDVLHAGDEVISRAKDLKSSSTSTGRVTIFRSGRASESTAGGGE